MARKNIRRKRLRDQRFNSKKTEILRIMILCIITGVIVWIATEWYLGLPVVYRSKETGMIVQVTKDGKPISQNDIGNKYHLINVP